jgi:soluble lytic murein transglycosylase-like protein
VILLLVTASAALAPTAFADTSTAELRAKLRSSRQALRAKRARLKLVRADLEAARQLFALYADTPLEDVIDGVVGDEPSFTEVALTADDPAADDPIDEPAVSDGTADATVADAALVDASGEEADVLPEVIVPSVDDIAALERRVARLRASARGWRERVEDLARRVRRRERIAEWNRRGEWRPLIELAARRYGVNASALYRLMIYESGGRRTAGTTYKGLFQYLPGTWQASWNPWADASIYNGWAQIRATAYAIKRGCGPSMWPSTYPRAF